MEIIIHHQSLQQLISFDKAESELCTIITGSHGQRGVSQFIKSKWQKQSQLHPAFRCMRLDLYTIIPEKCALLHLTVTQQTFVSCLLDVTMVRDVGKRDRLGKIPALKVHRVLFDKVLSTAGN